MKFFLLAFSFGIHSALAGPETVKPSNTRTISFQPSRPTEAVTVPGDFVGFGIETPFLNDYANSFSENLVDSVGKRMSLPPIIRIGGTSGDHVTYDPSLQEDRHCVQQDDPKLCPNGTTADFVLGKSYFDGFRRFPNARMTFQAPLFREANSSSSPSNYTATMEYVRLAFEKLGRNRTAAIALGNEVAYEKTGEFYANHAKALEANITKLLNLTAGPGQRIFEVLDTSSGSVDSQSPFTLQDAFKAGIDSNNLTKCAAEHYYQVPNHTPLKDLQAQLMNHSVITKKMVQYEKSINYLKANKPGVPYALSETGSALGGVDGITDSLGACLWFVDFQLYSMSKGVARVGGTQRPVSKHSLWIPVQVPGESPSVRAPFYAQPFVADFIGKTSKDRGVINHDLNSDFLTAYSLYEGSDLSRVALVNLRVWNSTSNSTRGSQAFTLDLPSAVKTVEVGRLHAEAGSSARGFDLDPSQNITWSGQQWAHNHGLGVEFPATASTACRNVTDSRVTITVPDSEAVVVYLRRN